MGIVAKKHDEWGGGELGDVVVRSGAFEEVDFGVDDLDGGIVFANVGFCVIVGVFDVDDDFGGWIDLVEKGVDCTAEVFAIVGGGDDDGEIAGCI